MTLTEIAANPADALAARLDRARDAYERMSDPDNADKWALVDGVLYVESSDGQQAWATNGELCDCPDATVGVGARFLGGTCKHIALFWLIAHQRAQRKPRRVVDIGDAAFFERETGYLESVR